MSKHFIIVNKQTNQIVIDYFGDEKSKDPQFTDENEWVHLEVPKGANVSILRVAFEKGKYAFFEDGSKRREYLKQLLQEQIDFVRNKRNMLLKESDWIVSVPDAPFTDAQKTAWKKYRQQLRDLPKTITRPDQEVKWPTPPV